MGSCSAAELLPASPSPCLCGTSWSSSSRLVFLQFSQFLILLTGTWSLRTMRASPAAQQPTHYEKYFPLPNFREALPPLWHNIFLLPEIPPLALFWGSFVWTTLLSGLGSGQ